MRNSPLLRSLLLIAALAVSPVARAMAEDEPADPAEAFAARVALLPAPSAEKAFRFEGVARIDGRLLGYAVLEMRPTAGDPAGWEAVDFVLLKDAGVPMTQKATTQLSRSLAPRSGTVESNRPGEGTITWQRTAEGFQASKAKEGGEPVTGTFEHAGTTLNTLSATIWFLQQALPTEATYRTTILEVEDGLKGEPAFQPVELKVLGKQAFQGHDVLMAKGTKDGDVLTVIFDPETHAVRAVELKKSSGTLQILAGDMWTMPAHDPVTAGLKVALALATKELHVLDDMFHWPSVHTRHVAANPPKEGEAAPTVQELRQRVMTHFSKQLSQNNAAMIQGFLMSLKDQVQQEKQDDGTVMLTFPESFRNLRLRVGAYDGVWSVVALPGQ